MRRQLRIMIEERDRGVALILVIGIGALVGALLTTAIVIAVSSTRHARDDADWQGALAAAYAGVEEYQSRLAADPSYVLQGNSAAPFTAASTVIDDATNPALGFGGSWASVPGSDGTASFRYEVDSSAYAMDGTLRLRSTGRVGTETRTIVTDLRQSDFLAYLYFTDYEIEDPAIYGRSSSCVKYAWAGRTSTCATAIAFSGGDEIRGQVHSNDTIYACQATFHGRVTTPYNPASGPRYLRPSGCGSTPDFRVKDPARNNSPSLMGVLGMPETNSEIRTAALDGGCLYTGATTITFNSGGTMTVRSPWTKQTRPGAANPTPSECGLPGTGTNRLGSGVTVPVPDRGAVYVQNVPASSSDPNGRVAREADATNCRGADGRTTGNGLGYPANNETAPGAIDGVAAYGCRNGDIFVQGTLRGEVTLAAENYVYVVGNTRYADRDRDMLGLIGNNMVWVYNPVVSSRTRPTSLTIEAAILSLRSFTVQNTATENASGYSSPTLTVRGSIAQRFRGVVFRSPGSGYIKDYQYDPRLLHRSPPHFLNPVSIAYGVTTWIETPPAIDANGTYR
ncbi:hypothetical protein [Agrococcus lahaulensis]|uniref:hypothetical protein n=1 Tax=Agrococcus lahaulensis TaxID=341722 RepID=UPI00047D174A|nr:hypothetical protein [Agrococcus lahaulensis]